MMNDVALSFNYEYTVNYYIILRYFKQGLRCDFKPYGALKTSMNHQKKPDFSRREKSVL